MRNHRVVCCTLLSLALIAGAQNVPAQVPAKTDVYRLQFAAAVTGKAGLLADFLKTQNPKSPMPGHYVVLRHQEGIDWDYLVIEHMGTSATVEPSSKPLAPSVQASYAWHTDSIVSGPPWTEFARAMGIDDQLVGKTATSVYLVTSYGPAPGHSEQLEKLISVAPGGSVLTAGYVLMQRLVGGRWEYLSISRFSSWQDFATDESASVSETGKNKGDFLSLRDYLSFHDDTIAIRAFPIVK